MKALFVVLATIFFTTTALAASPDCLTLAKEKKLRGAAEASFVRKCVREGCETTAAEKKLAGAAKTSFGTKCLANGLQGFCTEQADTKKLAGAARNSFMNKCQTGK